MVWKLPSTDERGWQPRFSDAAIQTCLKMKVLFGMPLRQTTGFVQSFLRLVPLGWSVPDWNSLCRRQRRLNVAIPYREGKVSMSLHIDSTGTKAEGERIARKHGGSKRRVSRNILIGIDEETLGVRAVEIIGNNIDDVPILLELLDQTSADEEIGSVTSNGAYETQKCHEAVAARNERLRASKRLVRAIWRRWSGEHHRSRVEAKTSCIKLIGQFLMARDFDCQFAGLQVPITVLNGQTSLGIIVKLAVYNSVWVKGQSAQSPFRAARPVEC